MASVRAQRAFLDDDSDEESPVPAPVRKELRHRLDSSDEDSPAAAAAPRHHHADVRAVPFVGQRMDESGDLRPTTPPTGATRNRPADQAAGPPPQASVDAVHGHTTGGSRDSLSHGLHDAAFSARRYTMAGPRSTASTVQPTTATKAAAARSIDHSSSEDDDHVAAGGRAAEGFMGGRSLREGHGSGSVASPRATRSSRPSNGSAAPSLAGAAPAASTAPSHRSVASSRGAASAGAGSSTAHVEPPQRSEAPSRSSRASRLHRTSSNASLSSEASRPESIPSSRQTQASKVIATVQRAIAQQHFMDSSSGEEEEAKQQQAVAPASLASVIGRAKSSASAASAAAAANSALPSAPARPGADVSAANSRHTSSKGLSGPSVAPAQAPGAAAHRRHTDTTGLAASPKPASRHAAGIGKATDPGAFSFRAEGQRHDHSDEAISPRMRQAAAAASAEVAAAAADSLRPAALTAIQPATLQPPRRPTAASAPAPQHSHLGHGTESGSIAEGAASTGGVARLIHLSSSQRITSWLQQQPSMASMGGITDDVASVCTTTNLMGADADAAAAMADRRTTADVSTVATDELLSNSIDIELPGLHQEVTAGSPRHKFVRLTVSSDDDNDGAAGKKAKAGRDGGSAATSPSAGSEAVQLQQRARRTAGHASLSAAASNSGRSANPVMRRLEFAAQAEAQAASASPHSSPSLRPSESSPSPEDAPSARVRSKPRGTPATASTVPRPAATGAPSPLRTMTASGALRAHREPNPERSAFEQDSSSARAALAAATDAARIASAGGLRHRVAPGGRMSPGDLRAMLSVLARPAWHSNSSQAPGPGASSAGSTSGSLVPGDSVQSFSYSELLHIMRAMSSAGGGSLAGLRFPPPSVDGSSVGSGRSGSSRSTRKATNPAPKAGSSVVRTADLAAPPVAMPQASPPTATKPEQRTVGAGAGRVHLSPPHGGSALPASSVGGSSMLMDEHPLAAPAAQEWSLASGSVASGALTREEQQQRDFAEMVRLWTLLTGRRVASDAFEVPVEAAGTPGPAATSPESTGAGHKPASARSVSAGRGVSAQSAAALAASAAAMATSAVIAAASSAYQPQYQYGAHAATVAGHTPQEQRRSRSVSPSPARLATAPAAAPTAPTRSPSPTPASAGSRSRGAVSPHEVQAQAHAQPRYTDFSSLPAELQQLARIVSAAGQLDAEDGHSSLPAAQQHLGRAAYTPQQQPNTAGSSAGPQDDLLKLVRLLSTAGQADEHRQQHAKQQQRQQQEVQTQRATTVTAEVQTDLSRLIRLLSAAGQTEAPPGTSSAASQTDLARLVRLLSAAGQTEEARTADEATSVGGLAAPPAIATAGTLVAGLVPIAASAATGGLGYEAATSVAGSAPSSTTAALSAGALMPGERAHQVASTATSTGGLTQSVQPLDAKPAAASVAIAEDAPGDAASVCSLSSHNSADTVKTGLALSRIYVTLRGMRLCDGGGQTDPPGMRTSCTQTTADLAARHRRSEGDQTEPPVSASHGVQTEGLVAELASGWVQTNDADIRAFATRSEGGQTELPSFASACQQTDAVQRPATLDGAAQAGGAHASAAGQTEAVGTVSAGQQVGPGELVPTSEGGAQTELSHLRGGPSRASQTELAGPATTTGVQTYAPSLPVARGLRSSASHTEEEASAPALAAPAPGGADLQAELVRVARLVAASGLEGEPLQLSTEAQSAVARLARLIPATSHHQAGAALPRARISETHLHALARHVGTGDDVQSGGSDSVAAGTQTVVTRALRLPSGQLVELEPLLPWMAEEAALEEASGGAEGGAGGWMQALRSLNAVLGDTPTSVSFTLPRVKAAARRSGLLSDVSNDGGNATGHDAPAGTAALQRALQILALSETDDAAVDLSLSASASSEADFPAVSPVSAAQPATTEDGVQTDLTALDLASALPSQSPQLSAKDASRPFQSSPGTVFLRATPNQADSASVAADSTAATSITAGPVIAPAFTRMPTPAPAAPAPPAELPPRAPSPPTTTQMGAAIALRNLPIASDGGLMHAPHQEAVVAGRVGSSGGMLAFLEAADPTTATALMELVQALQLMTLHSRRRRYVSDGSSVLSGTYFHLQNRPASPPVSLGGSSKAPTTLRGSFVTSIGPSVSQAGEMSLAGAAAAAAQTEAAAAVTAVTPALKAATVGGAAVAAAAANAHDGPAAATFSQRHTHTGGLPPRPLPPRTAVLDPTAQHLQRALRAVSGGGIARSQAVSAGGRGDGAATPTAAAAATAKPHIARALELLSSGGANPADAETAGSSEEEAELQAQEELVAALMALLTPTPAHASAGDAAEPSELASHRILAASPSDVSGEEKLKDDAHAAAALVQEAAAAEHEASEVKAAEEEATTSGPSSASSGISADMQRVLEQAERASASVSTLAGLPPSLTAAAEVLDGVPFEQAIGFIMDGLRDFDGGPSQLSRQLHMLYGPSSGGGAPSPMVDELVSRRQTAVGAASALEAVAGSESEAGSPDASGVPQLTEADRESIQALVTAALAAAEAAARGLAHDGASPPWLPPTAAEAPAASAADRTGELPSLDPQEPLAPAAEQLPPPSLALALSSSRSNSPARLGRPVPAATTGGLAHSLPMGMGPGRFDDGVPLRSAPGILDSVALAGHVRQQQTPPETPSASAGPSPLRLIEQLADMGADAFARLLPGMEDASGTAAVAATGGGLRSAPVTSAGIAPAQTRPVPPPPQTFGGAMDLPDGPQDVQQPHGVPILPYGDLDEHLRPLSAVEPIANEGDDGEAEDWEDLSPSTVAAVPLRLPTFATPSAPAVRGTPARSEPATTAGSAQAPAARDRLPHTVAGAPEQPAPAGPLSSRVSIDPVAGVVEPTGPGTEASEVVSLAALAASSGLPSQQQQQQNSPAGSMRSAPVTWAGAAQASTARQLQTAGGAVSSAPTASVGQPSAQASASAGKPEDQQVAPAPVVRSAPVSAGGQADAPARQSQTAGGALLSLEADPEIPALTALDRFKAPTPYYASPYKQSPNRSPEHHQVTSTSADASAAAVVVAGIPVAMAASGWSVPASSDDEAGPGIKVRLARDMMTGCRAVVPSAEHDSARRELVSPGAAGAPAPGSAEQLLSQAAELLLQAMQRAAEGQPEQEAALHVLSPVLKGLATPGRAELPHADPHRDAASRSAPVTMGGSPAMLAQAADRLTQQQQHSSPGALPGGEETCEAPPERDAVEESLERPRTAPAALQCDESEDAEPFMPFRSDGGAFSFSHGGAAAPQPETPTAANPVGAAQATVATAADLEAFKDDIMCSVRSALLEIVDMIGTTMVQHRAAAPEPEAVHAGAVVAGAGVAASEAGAESSEASYAASAAGDHQEIRITRSELEAFMFGKAVLSSTAAEDLLGVRLRDLYAPQLPQEDDGELVGGYDAATPGPNTLLGAASSAYSVVDVADMPSAGSAVATPSSTRPPQADRRGAASTGGLGASPAVQDAEADAFRSESGGIGVPRNSILRQPLGDGAGFKSLFRRSLEHLRGHLKPQLHSHYSRHAFSASRSRSSSPSSTPRAAPASPVSTAAAPKPPIPPRRLPQQHHTAPGAATLTQTRTNAGSAPNRAISAPGAPGEPARDLEATLAQGVAAPLAEQIAAAAAAAAADLEAAVRAADDVELDAHLSAGLAPEPATSAPRWLDPAAPSSRDSHAAGAEAFGEFLAALAEPVVQVAGLFLSPDPRSGGRVQQPQRSVVIEELAEGVGQGEALEQRHPPVRPSRGMPGHVGVDGGVVLADDDAAGFSPARGVESPRARSEASIPRLRLRPPSMEQALAAASRSTSATPLPRAAHAEAAGAAAAPSPLAPTCEDPSNAEEPSAPPHSPLRTTLSAHLKMASSPGSRGSPSDEDRPLSSFAASEGGARARTPSPLRRRTISPARPSRAAAVTPAGAPMSTSGPAQASPAASAAAAAAQAEPAVGRSLEELESFLRDFKSRISGGAEDAAAEAARVLHLLRQPLCPAAADAGAPHSPAQAGATALDETVGEEDLLMRAAAAVAAAEAWSAANGAAGSDDGEGSVMTGFNLHTIRASAASALAAAAAVEQTFSPRQEEEAQAAVRASGGSGTGTTGTATHSRGGSSTATPTNPVLREHLEHFQALLEKANTLVDRLMVADNEAGSEAGTDPATGSSTQPMPAPRVSTPPSAGSTRRQLHARLTQAADSVTPVPLAATAASPKPRSRANPRAPALPSLSVSAVSELSAVTPAPLSSGGAASLDPELAALFPATAARLSRPDALLEQSPDAAHTLVSSAVSAVPQLAAGAGRAHSLGSTPVSRSPTGSLAGASIATAAGSGASADATATAPASTAAATPLALVAALLAEAHSRMEFRSLDEQRGADKILSAVLDEHFANVLGTPRGFLTPQRQPAWLAAVVQAGPTAPAAAAAAANLSAAFNEAANVQAPQQGAPEAAGRPSAAAQPSAALAPVGAVPNSPLSPLPRVERLGAAVQAAADGPAERELTAHRSASMLPPQSQPQPGSKLHDMLAAIMQQRSDLLSSALDQVHRVAAAAAPTSDAAGVRSSQAAPAGATAVPSELPVPFLQPPLPQDISSAVALPIPALPAGTESDEDADALSQLQVLPMVLAALAVPATSIGHHNLPQPLMPYQEYDSESNPASYNVSLAGSARHPSSVIGESSYSRVPSGRYESPNYTGGHSVRSSLAAPTELAPGFLTRPAVTVSAGGVAAPSTAGASIGGASIASAPAAMLTGPAATPPAPAAPADLSHLLSDSDSLSAAPHSTVSVSNSAILGVTEVGSRVGSVTKGLGFERRPSQTVAHPASSGGLPAGVVRSAVGEEDTSESASLVSYTTGQVMYEQRENELAAFTAAVERSTGGGSGRPSSPVGGPSSTGGSSIHEGALRYNPVYDPAEHSTGGASGYYGISAGGAGGGYGSSNGSGGGGSGDVGRGGASAAALSGASRGHGLGLTSLHHETAYAPLALAAAAAAAVAGADVTPTVGGGALHARLLSAGGTSTAVLDSNPAYDLHMDSASRQASMAGVPPHRLEVSLSGGVSSGGANTGPDHPRLQLNFEASDASAGAGSARSAGPAAAGGALPLTPVGLGGSLGLPSVAGSVTGASENGLPSYPLFAGSDMGSFAASSDDLPSLLVPSLTESQVAMLAVAPELPSSRPQSRNMPRLLAAPPQQHQPLQHSASGAVLSSGSAAQSAAPSAASSRAVSQTSGQAQGPRVVSPAALAAAMATDGEVTGSVDFDELSREAAVMVDALRESGRSSPDPWSDPLNSTIRVRSARGLLGGGTLPAGPGYRDSSRASSAAGAPLPLLPLEALLPGAAFDARSAAEPAVAVVPVAAPFRSSGGSFEAPAGPLTAVSEDAEEEEQQGHAAADAGRAKGGLVAAAVRRFESGIPQAGPTALVLPPPAFDAALLSGVTSPKPVFKPASRTPSGLPRPPASPGTLQGGMSPAASVGPASRAGSVGPSSARSSRRNSAASLSDEALGAEPAAEVAPPPAAFEPSAASSDAAFFAAGSPGISMSFSEEALGLRHSAAAPAAAPSSSGEAFYVMSGTPGLSSEGEELEASASAEVTSALVTREWVPGAEEDEEGGPSLTEGSSAELPRELVPGPRKTPRAPTVVAFGRSTSNPGAASRQPASPGPLRAVRSSSPDAASAGIRSASPAPQRATSGAAALALARANRAQSPAPSRAMRSTFSGASATRGGSEFASPASRPRNSMPGGAFGGADDASRRSPVASRHRSPQAAAAGPSPRGASQAQSPARVARGGGAGGRSGSSSVPGGRVVAEAVGAGARAGGASVGGVPAETAQGREPVPLHEAVRAYRTSRRPQM